MAIQNATLGNHKSAFISTTLITSSASMSYDNSFLTFMNMIAGILAINVEYWKKVDSDHKFDTDKNKRIMYNNAYIRNRFEQVVHESGKPV